MRDRVKTKGGEGGEGHRPAPIGEYLETEAAPPPPPDAALLEDGCADDGATSNK